MHSKQNLSYASESIKDAGDKINKQKHMHISTGFIQRSSPTVTGEVTEV